MYDQMSYVLIIDNGTICLSGFGSSPLSPQEAVMVYMRTKFEKNKFLGGFISLHQNYK